MLRTNSKEAEKKFWKAVAINDANRAQINKIRNERGQVTIDIIEIQS